jgi:hypothetical protein
MSQELSPKIGPQLSLLPASSNVDPNPVWHHVDKLLFVNKKFFEIGFVLIKENDVMNKKARQQIQSVIGNDYFFINERIFYMSLPNQEKIVDDSKLAERPMPDVRSVRRTSDLLEKLTDFSRERGGLFYKNNPVVFNAKRREEVFSALIFDGRGIYIFPWLSKNNREFESNKSKFLGFNQFVTAGCLFGSSMRGEDQYGRRFQIFKHDIQFFPIEKIETVIFDIEKSNPYEETLFKEFEFFAKIINKFSNPDELTCLLYHLPYYDYILFGVELFIRGKITLEAFDFLVICIFSTRDRHIEKINAICARYGIMVTISSPFENLFIGLDTEKQITAQIILELLRVPADEVFMEDGERILEKERQLVKWCLKNLLSRDDRHNFNPTHHKVWSDFVGLEDGEKINNIEDLFKVANAVMIGLGSSGSQPYKTCSILSILEKQIQVQYQKFASKNDYPPIFNLTVLETLLAYNARNKGPLYYFDYAEGDATLSKLIEEYNILEKAHKNIGFFAEKYRAKNQLVENPDEKSVAVEAVQEVDAFSLDLQRSPFAK